MNKLLNKINILSPEEVLEKIKDVFNKERRSLVLTSFIFGIIVHFLLLVSLIASQDGLMHILHYSAGGYEASLGRWGITFFDSLRNDIAIPFITTMISIVVLSFTNMFIIEIFGIKNKIFKLLSIFAFVVSPSLCLTLLYTYTADVYFWSMFLSVFCVYSLYKIKNRKVGVFLAGISFILMLSTYQSYIGFTIGLIVMINIKDIVFKNIKVLESFKDLLVKAFILIVSAIVYYLITIILLKVMNLEMTTYGGVNEITLVSIFTSIVESIKNAYLGFIKYYFADGIILNRTWDRDKLYFMFFVLFGLVYITLFINDLMKKENKKKDIIIRFIFVLFLTILLPVFLNIVLILAPGNSIYFLTSTQMVLIIPFLLTLLEGLNSNIKKKSIFVSLLNWGGVIVLFIIFITYAFSIVVTYQTLELSYNQAKSTATRILTRIEEVPGYRKDMNYLIAGVIDDINSPKTLDLYNYALTNTLKSSLFHGTYIGQETTWKNFMNVYTGVHMNFCSDYEYYTIIHSDEFKDMDIFPGENSVKMINDVMVIKFTNTPDLPPYSENLLEHGISY